LNGSHVLLPPPLAVPHGLYQGDNGIARLGEGWDGDLQSFYMFQLSDVVYPKIVTIPNFTRNGLCNVVYTVPNWGIYPWFYHMSVEEENTIKLR
jgi:hypothetical protein